MILMNSVAVFSQLSLILHKPVFEGLVNFVKLSLYPFGIPITGGAK